MFLFTCTYIIINDEHEQIDFKIISQFNQSLG